jgi:hypothetical protein
VDLTEALEDVVQRQWREWKQAASGCGAVSVAVLLSEVATTDVACSPNQFSVELTSECCDPQVELQTVHGKLCAASEAGSQRAHLLRGSISPQAESFAMFGWRVQHRAVAGVFGFAGPKPPPLDVPHALIGNLELFALAAWSAQEIRRLRAELKTANSRLAGRKLVERAKGVLQELRNLSEEQAYEYLRSTSRQRRITLEQLAAEILRRGRSGANTAKATLLACLILITMLLPRGAFAAESAPIFTAEKIEFFEKKVRPIFVEHCYTCHSADTQPHGELRVDDRNGLIRGGDSGPAVVPGHAEQSLLLKRVTSPDAKRRMPKEGAPLSEGQIAGLTAWIKDGAAWPSEQVPARYAQSPALYERLRTKHWAWQPLATPKVPTVSNTAWPDGDIDRFVLAKLEENQLAPVRDADRKTLIRRVTYDLTGLPPAPAEIDAFIKDKSKLAYARLVDRLLGSPHFGEAWGRHWLDIARYGESTGPSRNIPYPHAWRYRNYVIDSINRDVPFDRFIREQLAGDLLPAANNNERDRLLTATGFLALGAKDVNQRFKERFLMDNVDEKIDTVSRSILATTVSCARCHDHKFDPIPQADYYALAGIFASTEDAAGLRSKMGGGGLDYYNPKALLALASYVPAAQPGKVANLQKEVAEAKQSWDEIADTPEALTPGPDGKSKDDLYREKYETLLNQLLVLDDPGTRGYAVHGVRDGLVGDTAIRIRGEAERIGPTVPRGFLSAFKVPGAPSVNPAGSGRLEMAEWLTSPNNPLTPRVAVNRAWQHLFGEGIVSTVDNFGLTGDKPADLELLDYLSQQFIRDGWSLKRLVRRLVLTRTYRLSSESPAAYREQDPGNRLLWRHSPRRLSAEEIRDAMLATAGRLQLTPPARSPVSELKMVEIDDNGAEARQVTEQADRSVYRSVYLPLLRGVTPKSLEAFDPVTQTLVTGQRDATTVPTQALFLLNSTFVRRQALALADGLLAESDQNAKHRIRQGYRLLLGRDPGKSELKRVQIYLSSYAASYAALPAPPPAVVKPIAKAADGPANAAASDDLEHAGQAVAEELVQPKNAQEAAWMSFAQSLFAAAEFRFVR